MNGKGRGSVLKSYVGALIAVLLFPLLWLRALRMARRHTDVDPRGPLKIGLAIAVSVGILAVGGLGLLTLQRNATEGVYDSLDTRMSILLGESEYQSNLNLTETKPAVLAGIAAKIASGKAANNNTTALEEGLAAGEKELADAQAKVQELTPNHALYVQVSAAVEDQDDARVRSLIESAGLAKPADIPASTDAAFATKERSLQDMRGWLLFMLWPSLIGAFFAPLAFALGSILKAGLVPSDSVGFKPYPGGAAGLFLLFGAFGLPSIPFAAWTFMDAEQRSLEGQISL